MNNPRVALVAMLVAVEIVLIGMMMFALNGGAWNSGVFAASSGFHHVNITGKTYAPVAAGLSPHVQIDDPYSGVHVSASNDGLVHVQDLTSVHGFVWGESNIADLTISRTFDGVHIVRPTHTGSDISVLGSDFERIEVQVPSGSHVDIGHSSSAEVAGMNNNVDVLSQDGHIALSDIRGNVSAHSDDGHVDAVNVTGDNVAISSDDGSVHLRNVNARLLSARSADGRIEALNLAIDGAAAHATLHTDDGTVIVNGRFTPKGSYDFSTGDGRVELGLAPGADLTIDASTGDGHIYVDGTSYGDGDAAAHTVRVGGGSGAMRLTSQDGSIHITTNGAI